MIPDASDPRWKRVLSSESDLANVSLATRILVTRLRREVKAQASLMSKSIEELRTFASKNAFAAADVGKF